MSRGSEPAAARAGAALVAAFLLALSSHARAATVSGFLTDRESGESLAYASVLLSGEGLTTGSPTNEEGYYALTGLPAGTFTLAYACMGYLRTSETVTLATALAVVRRDVALTPAPIEGEGVEVTAGRGEDEGDLQPGFLELAATDLQRMPAFVEQDIIRSLQLLPGIQAASDISSGLYVRGGGPDQTLILLDQIPLYNPTHAFGFFSTFNADAIKDVNLYKGAYPAAYGGRLGSVLDVANRDGNRNAFHGRGGASMIAARTTLEGPVGNGSWIASGRRTYLDPILAAVRNDTTEVPEYYFYDLNARANQSFGESDRLVVSGYMGRDDLFLDLDEGSSVGIRWGNNAATAKWTHLFSPALFGNFLVAGSEYFSTTSLSLFETPISWDNRLRDLSLKGDLDTRVGSRHRLTTGFWASRYEFSFTQEFNRDVQIDLEIAPYSYAGYVQDEWAMTPATTVRAGLRGQYFSEGSRWMGEPRLSVSRSLSPTVRLKAAGGVYHQFLQLVATEGFSGGDFWVPIDASAEPGRSWQAVLGSEWEPSRQWFLSAEAYYTGLSNLVVLDNAVSADAGGTESNDVFQTGGSGHATGVEVFCERRTGALTGWVGYALGRSRRRFPEMNQGREFPPKYDRRHDFKVVTSYRAGPWTYGADLVYGTGQAFTPAGARYSLRSPATGVLPRDDYLLPAEHNSARLLPYHRLDVSAARQGSLFGWQAQWHVQIFNVYSRRNEWFVTYDAQDPETKPEVARMLPIIPTVGVSFEF